MFEPDSLVKGPLKREPRSLCTHSQGETTISTQYISDPLDITDFLNSQSLSLKIEPSPGPKGSETPESVGKRTRCYTCYKWWE